MTKTHKIDKATIDLGHIFQGRYLAIEHRAGHGLCSERARWLALAAFNLPFPTPPQLAAALFVADYSLIYYTAYVVCTRVVEAKKGTF